MPNRKAPACSSGLGLRKKDEDDEERSHPGPVSAGCLKILLGRVSRQTRKRSWRAPGPSSFKVASRDFDFRSSPSGQCSRHAPGAFAVSLAAFNGVGRPRRLALRESMGTLLTSLLSCGAIHCGSMALIRREDGAATVAPHWRAKCRSFISRSAGEKQSVHGFATHEDLAKADSLGP